MQYAGLKLGMSPQEVMYTKGYPSGVFGEKEESDPVWKGWFHIIKTNELPEGKKVTDYTVWSYDQYKHSINVGFNNERTAVIDISCKSEDKDARCPSIGSVRDGISEQDAVRKLGTPYEQRIEGVTKRLLFPQLGVALALMQEKVFYLKVYDPQPNR